MKTTDTHIYFWGGPFSNWHPFPIEDNTIKGDYNFFRNSEQAYMYYKAKLFKDTESAELIKKTPDPKLAKKLGRGVKNFNATVWDEYKFDVMVHVNMLKFRRAGNLENTLLETKKKILVEASPYDKIWGVGLSEDDPLILDEANWKGENLLGKALMEVRFNIVNEIGFNTIHFG